MRKLDITEVQKLLLDLMKVVHDFMEENQIEYYLLGGSALGAVRHKGFIPWDDDIDIGLTRENYEKFLRLSSKFCSNYEIQNFTNHKYCDYGLTRIYINNTYIDNDTLKKTKLDKRLYFDIFPLDNVPEDTTELKIYEKRIFRLKKIIQRIDVRIYDSSKIKIFIKKIISFFLKPFRKRILSSFDSLIKKYRYYETRKICSLCSQYGFDKQVMFKEIYGRPTLHKFEDADLYVPEKVDVYLTTLFGNDYMELPPLEKRRKGHDIYMIEEC